LTFVKNEKSTFVEFYFDERYRVRSQPNKAELKIENYRQASRQVNIDEECEEESRRMLEM
jgi:hypothetical protein